MPDCQTQQKSDKIKVVISITFPIPWNFASPGPGHRNTRTQTFRRAETYFGICEHINNPYVMKVYSFFLSESTKRTHRLDIWPNYDLWFSSDQQLGSKSTQDSRREGFQWLSRRHFRINNLQVGHATKDWHLKTWSMWSALRTFF